MSLLFKYLLVGVGKETLLWPLPIFLLAEGDPWPFPYTLLIPSGGRASWRNEGFRERTAGYSSPFLSLGSPAARRHPRLRLHSGRGQAWPGWPKRPAQLKIQTGLPPCNFYQKRRCSVYFYLLSPYPSFTFSELGHRKETLLTVSLKHWQLGWCYSSKHLLWHLFRFWLDGDSD